MKIPALVLLFAPGLFAPVLLAQATLTPNQTVVREIAPGTTQAYSIRLDVEESTCTVRYFRSIAGRLQFSGPSRAAKQLLA